MTNINITTSCFEHDLDRRSSLLVDESANHIVANVSSSSDATIITNHHDCEYHNIVKRASGGKYLSDNISNDDNANVDHARGDGVEVWNALCFFLKREYGSNLYKNCFMPLKFVRVSGGSIVLSAPNRAIRSLVLQTYFHKIHNFITSNYKDICIIEVLLEQLDERSNDNQSILVKVDNISEKIQSNGHDNDAKIGSNDRDKKSISYTSKSRANSQLTMASLLDNSLTFDNFIYGIPNKIAYNAARELAAHSSSININGLCIHGDIGMGKTHLLQSIANQMSSEMKVAYFTCEKFSREYVKAIKNNTLGDFKYYLSELDMLLLDDLQFVCGKQGTERELTHAFDGLMELSKKVVISSSHHPSQLNLDPRSKSRFVSCLAVGIDKCNFDLRIRILEHKFVRNEMAKQLGINQEMLYLIAYHVDNNIRELEASLNRVVAYCRLAEIKASPEIVHDLVVSRAGMGGTRDNRMVSYESIVQIVSDYFSVDQIEIVSRSRTAKISHARQVAAYLMRELSNMSVKQIGISLGNRDHSTVVYMINAVRNQSNALRMQQLDEVRRRCIDGK